MGLWDSASALKPGARPRPPPPASSSSRSGSTPASTSAATKPLRGFRSPIFSHLDPEVSSRNLYGHVHEAPGGGGEGRGDHGSEQSGSEDCDHSERSDGLEQVLPVLLSDLRSEEGGVGSVVVVVAVVVVGVLHVAVVVQVVLLPGLRVLAGHWLGGRRHDVGGGVRQHGAQERECSEERLHDASV